MEKEAEKESSCTSSTENSENHEPKGFVYDLLPASDLKSTRLALSTESYQRKRISSPVALLRRFDDNMTHLDLSYYGLGRKGVELLLVTIRDSKSLKDLNVTGNGLSDNQLCRLVDAVLFQKTITKLNLCGNTLAKTSVEVLGTGLGLPCALEDLNLSETKLSDRYFHLMMTSGMKNNKSIKVFDLSKNSLGDCERKDIGGYICHASNLIRLNVSWNQLRGKAAMAVCHALGSVSHLEDINIARNGIADHHMPQLEKSLSNNFSLTKIDLSGNRITNRGAKLLARGLQNNCSLQSISLGDNPILALGAHFIITSLITRPLGSLAYLDLQGVDIDSSLFDALALYQNINPNFKYKVGTLMKGKVIVPEIRLSTVQVLDRCLQARNLRILDVFRQLDRTSSQEISRGQFVRGILRARFPFRRHQAYELFDEIDVERKGTISYSQVHKVIRESREKVQRGKRDTRLYSSGYKKQRGELDSLTTEEYDPQTNEIIEGQPLTLRTSFHNDQGKEFPGFNPLSLFRRAVRLTTPMNRPITTSPRQRKFSDVSTLSRERAGSLVVDESLKNYLRRGSVQSSPLPLINSRTMLVCQRKTSTVTDGGL